MKNGKVFYVLIIAAAGLQSCALTKSQLYEVNRFAVASRNFSAYPGTILKTVNDVHVRSLLYNANSTSTDSTHVNDLKQISGFKAVADSISPRFDISFKLINQYGQALAALTSASPVNKLDSSTIGLGPGLDSLSSDLTKIDKKVKLPTGIGQIIGEAISFFGKLYIQSQQAKEIKKCVAKGDTLVNTVTTEIIHFLTDSSISQATYSNIQRDAGNYRALRGPSLSQILAFEDSVLPINYRLYLESNRDFTYTFDTSGKHPARLTSTTIFKAASVADDYHYVQLQLQLVYAEQLRVQAIAAAKALAVAHNQLYFSLLTRKDEKKLSDDDRKKYKDGLKKNKMQRLTDFYAAASDYVQDIQNSNATVSKISSLIP